MPERPFDSPDTLLLMDLSAENYELLLNWLHPNRPDADKEYQRIRKLLIKHFQKYDCSNPEQLADATVDRVAEKLTTTKIQIWVGAKERHFYSVGFYVLLEEKRKHFPEIQIPVGLAVTQAEEPDEDLELMWQCFEKCLLQQPEDKRELVVRYYRGTSAIKIKNRAQLAKEQGLSLPRLRVNAGRIRTALKTCIERCMENASRQSRHSLSM